MKKQLILIFLLVNSISIFCQTPPEEFFKGLDLLKIDTKKSKEQFQIALKKDSLFHGTYHFLGVIYLEENRIDSAITCFKQSVFLNTENVNHTREMTYVRLIDAYLYQHDFSNSFDFAWEAYQLYPDNNTIERSLKDVCLWSFYINHNGLDSSYLSSEIRDEYIVNSVPEEYLIIRKLRIDDHYLIFSSQKQTKKKKVNYDVITCNVSKSNKTIDVKFRLNWDLKKNYGGNVINTDDVFSNSELPIFDRVGALLVSDSDINLKKEIKKLVRNEK